MIKFIGKKGISERPLVSELVNQINKNPKDFIYIARVFSIYSNNEVDLNEIEIQIRHNLMLAFMPSERVEKFTTILLEIYQSKKFNEIRAEVLENIAYTHGPVTKGLKSTQRYIEPTIKVGDVIVGKSKKKCDLVFYHEDLSPMEFIECKTNISNVIPWNKPFEEMSKTHQDKIKYLSNVYHYLKDYYCKPRIYFACYNEDYENELTNLQENLGYPFIDLVSPTEMIEGK